MVSKEHMARFGQGLSLALESKQEKEVAHALHLLSLRMIKMGGLWKESLVYLRKALEMSNYRDEDLIKTIGNACNTLKDYACMAEVSFQCAYQAIKSGEYARAAEALGFAWFAYSYKKLGDEALLSVVDTELFYKTIARSLNVPFQFSGRAKNRKFKVGHVIFRLYDQGYSPTRLLKTFIKNHDYGRFDISVYNSEDIILRPQPKFTLASPLPPSNEFSVQTRAMLQKFKVPYYVAPLDGSCIDSALALSKKIYDDNVDVLIYHSSVMCPVACITSFLRPAPVQINMNIGASMFLESLDCATYFTETSWKTEKDFWDKRCIRSLAMPSGVDYSTEDGFPAVKRSEFNIPQNALVFFTCGNLLPQRMSQVFQDSVATLLEEHGEAFYLVIGDGDFSLFKSLLSSRGVLGRVRFAGFRKDAPEIAKVADIYLNEFPEGGGLSVLEAMIAGKPAVAMNSGGSVTTSAGASYVGKEFEIANNDLKGYIDFANRLAKSVDFRRQVGVQMRRRYEEVFSPVVMVRAFEELATDLYSKKTEGRS